MSPGTDAQGGAVGASRDVEAGERAVETFAGWELRDPPGGRVGRVSRVFLDPSGRAVQVEVAMGPFGLRKILLPVTGVRVDRKDRALLLGRARGRSAPAGPGSQGLWERGQANFLEPDTHEVPRMTLLGSRVNKRDN